MRLVSNLPFLSKVTEKVVAAQLTKHLADHNIYGPLLSAYRLGHSRETALLKIKDDIDCGLNRGEGMLLVLLDRSAAFDTVDHDTLLNRLRGAGGWHQRLGSALAQVLPVREDSSVSPSMALCPQRSSWTSAFLRALYWVLCSSSSTSCLFRPPSRSMRQSDIMATRTTASSTTSFHVKDKSSYLQALHCVEACLEDVRVWIVANRLKLKNEDKAEFMVIPSPTLPYSIPAGWSSSCPLVAKW